jgi:LemA protein
MWVLIIVLLLLLIPIVVLIAVYNNLVKYRNRYKNAFAQIEVQLKRRYDLIPNLVEAAKAYLKHERETLEAVIAARNQAVTAAGKVAADPSNAQSIKQFNGAEGILNSALGRLFAVMEAYPDLKASQTIQQLSEEITSTENRIAFARQAFNDQVNYYNTYVQSFPGVILSGPLKFDEAQLLEIEGYAHHEAPKVSL